MPRDRSQMGRHADRDRSISGADGFTLIELLVVVGIIAILSAVAVINFQAAQVRSRVAAGKAGLRNLSSAVEQYHVDWNRYPQSPGPSIDDPFGIFAATSLAALTTPIAYVSAQTFIDPFGELQANPPQLTLASTLDPPTPINRNQSLFYFYYPHFSGLMAEPDMNLKAYCAASIGPDARDSLVVYYPFPRSLGAAGAPYGINNVYDTLYDPTNGTVSRGDLAAFGGQLNVPPLLGGGP